MSLIDKVAIVTGASRGIGMAISRALSREGVIVFAIARSTPDDIELSNRITPLSADIRDQSEVDHVIQKVLKHSGTIDILINNAGIEYFKPLINTTIEDYDKTIDTNLRGAFLFTKLVLPIFLAKHSGDLLFINSLSGLRGFSQDSIYCASKHGLSGFAIALEEELRPEGIRVCSIFPGATDTQLSLDSWSPKDDPKRAYFLKPEDIAETVVFVLKQDPHICISQIVMRPFIETPFSDFLSLERIKSLFDDC